MCSFCMCGCSLVRTSGKYCNASNEGEGGRRWWGIAADTGSGPQFPSVIPLHWEPAPSLKRINAFSIFLLLFPPPPSWGSIAKKKKGSGTEVEVGVLSKDNLTVDWAFVRKQGNMESHNLEAALSTIVGIMMTLKTSKQISRDKMMRRNRIC